MKNRFLSWPRAAAGLVTMLALAALTPSLPGGSALAQSARERGFLGVMLQDLSGDLRDSYDYRGGGVLVTDVTSGSAADRAGVRDGDIVTRFRGRRVDSSSDLTQQVRDTRPGERVSLTVWRDGRERTLSATMGSIADRGDDEQAPSWRDRGNDNDNDNDNDNNAPEMPDTPVAPQAPRVYHFEGKDGDLPNLMRGYQDLGRPRLGVEIQDLDRDLGEYFDRTDGKGVLVLHVVDGSAAKSAGIRAGDVIVSVGDRSVDDGEDLRKELRDREAGPVSVVVVRRGTRQTVSVRLPERREPMAFGRGNDFRYFNRSAPGPRSGNDSEHQRALRKQMDELRKQMDELRREMRRGDQSDPGDEDDD